MRRSYLQSSRDFDIYDGVMEVLVEELLFRTSWFSSLTGLVNVRYTRAACTGLSKHFSC